MAFFTFIFCIAILTFDSLNFNSIFSGLLLLIIDFILCAMTLASWLDYLIEKHWSIAKVYQILCMVIGLIIGIIFLWSNYVFMLLLNLIVFSVFLFIHIVHKKQKDNYNYRAISKYALYALMVSLLGACVLYFAVQKSFLYDLAPIGLKKIFTVFVSHILLLSKQINIWRPLFVILCILNAFVLPLILAYVKGRKESNVIKWDLDKNYKKALSNLEKIVTEYDDLKSEINAKA